MSIDLSFTWLMLLMLGIFHGINPGMGWLLAVGIGLQEQQRAAVWRSLLPLALGHAFAVAAAVVAAGLFSQAVPLSMIKWAVAGFLFALGAYRLFRHGHPRYGGMQIGSRQLTIWSFLMASAHGAGLMVLPFIFDRDSATSVPGHHHGAHMAEVGTGHIGHAGHGDAILAALPADPIIGLLATGIHTAGYLLITGIVAVVVYEKLGLRLLKSAWINIDLIWAAALIITAIWTLFL
jgi:hypothetical protein